MTQRATPRTFSPPAVIQKMQLGINKYTDPTLTNPTQWYEASNVFSGPFGYVQRARFANLVTNISGGAQEPITSLYNYYPPSVTGANPDTYWILADAEGLLFAFDTGNNFGQITRPNPWINPNNTASSQLNGPWMRQVLGNILYEVNGQVKQTWRRAAYDSWPVETFGIDAPDTAPQVSLASPQGPDNITSISRSGNIVTVVLNTLLTVPGGDGVGMMNVAGVSDTSYNGTFVVLTGSGSNTLTYANIGPDDTSASGGTAGISITKSIGRSYAYAWENANKAHVSAPSPSTQYIQYNSQFALIYCIQIGTIAFSTTSYTVTGTGTYFTEAWVGKYITAIGLPSALITAVDVSAQTLTIDTLPTATESGGDFQVYDYGTTHVRLYATADGGATYYRIQRNAFDPANFVNNYGGLAFADTANAEPPNFPFTTETSQLYNIPPPIGKYLYQYMGQLIMFGVNGATQSLFYSNQGLTTIGLPQESFAPLNQITLPIQGANIGGMAAFPSSLIVWDDKEDMFRITGLLADNTTDTATSQGATVTQLPFGIGCANPFAIAECPLGAVWLSPQNEIWLYTDYYAPRNIGRSVQGILNGISRANLGLVRATYYHTDVRDWVVFAIPYQSDTNNKLLILDVDLLASNGSPSFFLFDMATNHPSWYVFDLPCPSIATIFQADQTVSLIVGSTNNITNADFQGIGGGTEYESVTGYVKLHAFGNDTPFVFKRPQFFRFLTNQRPSSYQAQGWSFSVDAFDDDKYTFGYPLTLALTPGVNDTATLSGHTKSDPLSLAESFRYSQARFRIGAVNFIMGRRFQFQCNFPTMAGTDFQWYGLEMGYAISPPR